MTDLWKKAVHLLDSQGQRLEGLRHGLQALEADVRMTTYEKWEIQHCLDYGDLYRYLDLDYSKYNIDIESRPHEREDALREYVTVLLIHNIEPPVLFFPWYFQEFRLNVTKMYYSYNEAEKLSRRWADHLQAEIRKELNDKERLLGYLLATEREGKEISAKVLEEKLHLFQMRTREFYSYASHSLKGAQFLQRFDSLVKLRKLQSLRTALGSPKEVRLERDRIYREARESLDRKRPESTENNGVDAMAISAVTQLNRLARDQRKRFSIVTGDQTVIAVVSELNRGILDRRNESIDVRDWDFWKLYFSLHMRAEESELSLIEELGLLKMDLQPYFWQLRTQFRQLGQLMNAVPVERQRSDEAEILQKVEIFTREVESAVRKLAEPLLDARWRLAMVSDLLSTVEPEMKKIRNISAAIARVVSEIRAGTVPISVIAENIRSLLRKIDNLVADIKERVQKAREELSTSSAVFHLPVLGEGIGFASTYQELLARLFKGGRKDRRWVRGRLRALENKASKDFEFQVVSARLEMSEREYEKASWRLDRISSMESQNPEVIFSRIMIHLHRSEWAKALALVEEIEVLGYDLVVDFLKAKIYSRQFRESGGDHVKDRAMEHGRRAWTAGEALPLGYRISLATDYFELLFDSAETLTLSELDRAAGVLDNLTVLADDQDFDEAVVNAAMAVKARIEAHRIDPDEHSRRTIPK